jgi:hypothetical protein
LFLCPPSPPLLALSISRTHPTCSFMRMSSSSPSVLRPPSLPAFLGEDHLLSLRRMAALAWTRACSLRWRVCWPLATVAPCVNHTPGTGFR